MLMEIVEKKGKNIQTKVTFSKKEWNQVPAAVKMAHEKAAEKKETARNVYFMLEGDLINIGKSCE